MKLVVVVTLLAASLGCEPVDIERAGQNEQMSETAPVAAPVPMASIMATSEALGSGTELTDEVIELVEIPRKYVSPDMLLADNRGDVVGRPLLHGVPKGALLARRDFERVEGGAVGQALEPIIVELKDAERRSLKDKASAALMAKGTAAYVGTLTIEPGAGVPQHQDPTEEFLYVLEGGGTITIDGTSHEIGPETVVFMPAGAEVSFQNGAARTRVVQVFAGPGPASKYDDWDAVKPDAAD